MRNQLKRQNTRLSGSRPSTSKTRTRISTTAVKRRNPQGEVLASKSETVENDNFRFSFVFKGDGNWTVRQRQGEICFSFSARNSPLINNLRVVRLLFIVQLDFYSFR